MVVLRIILITTILFGSYVYAGTIDELCEKLQKEECERECNEHDDTGLSPLDKRIRDEKDSFCSRFSIVPHKPNYILLVSYNSTPHKDENNFYTKEADQYEVKFQLSIKTAIWPNMFGMRNIQLQFAYTQQSYWQLYSFEKSSPFRETNYEPELMISYYSNQNTIRLLPRVSMIGLLHQSNGQSGNLSRSWNRIYANFIFEKTRFLFDNGYLYVSFKPWIRIKESEEKDDNPDIDKFMGHGELRLLYYMDKKILHLSDHVLTFMFRNNFRNDNKGAIQIDYSFRSPLSKKLKFYIQYFNGYGESLIDYNHSNNRIGVGIMLNDWL